MPSSEKTINIVSSNAVGGDVAFVIDARTGRVLRATVDVAAFGQIPESFDLEEFARFYRHTSETIDVLDIGYTLPGGQKVAPSADFRINAMRGWYFAAARHHNKLLAAMENILLRQGEAVTQADEDMCRKASEFLRRVQYTTTAADPDGAAAADGKEAQEPATQAATRSEEQSPFDLYAALVVEFGKSRRFFKGKLFGLLYAPAGEPAATPVAPPLFEKCREELIAGGLIPLVKAKRICFVHDMQLQLFTEYGPAENMLFEAANTYSVKRITALWPPGAKAAQVEVVFADGRWANIAPEDFEVVA